MDNMIDLQIEGLNHVIKEGLNNSISKLTNSIENYKKSEKDGSLANKMLDKLDFERAKDSRSHLTNAIKNLSRLQTQVSVFSRNNAELLNLMDEIKAIPLLDADGIANKSLIDAVKKDFRETKGDISSQVDSLISDAKKEVDAAKMSCHVYYGGNGEKRTYMRGAYPQFVNEPVISTIDKLGGLYNNKVNDYGYIRSSSEELQVSSLELKTIEEYERMYKENKIDIKPKRRMFFIKQSPLVVIDGAKKAAIDKAHALAVRTKLGAINVPSKYGNTAVAIQKIKEQYLKIYQEADKKLQEFDLEHINSQVKKVQEEEQKEQAYQDELKRAEVLGYRLEQARAEGNKELEAQIVEQIRTLNLRDYDKSSSVSEGQSRYKTEVKNKEYETQIMREEMGRRQEMERNAQTALYNEAKRQLEAEGRLDPIYVQGGLDGVNIVDSAMIDRLIKERMEQIEDQNREINNVHKEQEESIYHLMSPEQVALEFLKSTNTLASNATLQDAMNHPDFGTISRSVRDGADLTDEINEALARREEKEKRAYKMFKIDKSKYDALSATRRQQIVNYVSMLHELDDSKVQRTFEFKNLQRQIDYDIQLMGEQSPLEGQGRRL